MDVMMSDAQWSSHSLQNLVSCLTFYKKMLHGLLLRYDSWTVGQLILELILGTPRVFDLTNFDGIKVLKEFRHPDYYFVRMASIAEHCIGLPDVVEIEKMNKLTTCSDDGYADYIRNRDPLHLGFPDVELLKLVRLLMKADPNLRISMDEALHHA